MTEEHFSHKPVLLQEVLDGLNINPRGNYIDGTFGRGGHSHCILERLAPEGRLIVFDKDPQAIVHAKEKYAKENRLSINAGSFSEMQTVITDLELNGKIDGILLDLGVSSPQLDDAARGFSFLKSGALDMRMDPGHGQSAAQWINSAAEAEIADVLKTFGEERYAKRLAKAIVVERGERPFTDTKQLAETIKLAHPRWEKGKHPATRSFQAIRIFINNELGDLKQGLARAFEILAPGGRMAIISFHSLEDRMVKRFFKQKTQGEQFPLDLPIMDNQVERYMKLIGKAIKAGRAEVQDNPRARSAVLRIAEKL